MTDIVVTALERYRRDVHAHVTDPRQAWMDTREQFLEQVDLLRALDAELSARGVTVTAWPDSLHDWITARTGERPGQHWAVGAASIPMVDGTPL